MGFNIAIYNGFSEDTDKIINSFKAAYLYADKVTVYDPSRLLVVDEYSDMFWWRDETKEIPLQEFFSRIYHMNRKTREARAVGNNRETESAFYEKLREMGIEVISPLLNKKEWSVDISSLFGSIDIFLKDPGFKVLNDLDSFADNKDIIPSMWSPSYLSGYAISSLPGFEEATIDELIDIRKELERYIIPYRASIVRMAEDIKEIPDIGSLQQECMRLYIRDIEPKVAAINSAVHDNNVLENIARNILKNEKTWAGIGALIAAFAAGEEIAGAIGTAAALTLGGTAVSKGIIDAVDTSKKIKDNEMFFLYEAGKKIREK